MQIKLITVITDGRSNIGGDPSYAAKQAKEQGIIVNAIGIIGTEEYSDEIKSIAESGGGIWDMTSISNLSETMTTLTQKSIQTTLENIVSDQVKEITGKEVSDIKPEMRTKIADYIDGMSDKTEVKMVILLDTSGSMVHKIQKAKESVIELLKTLKGREGQFSVMLMQFPGANGMTKVLNDFTDKTEEIENIVACVGTGGGTPTYYAIKEASLRLTEQPDLKSYVM